MFLSGTNLDHGQRYNRRVVLETVRLRGPLSRAEIARITGLSAQTISNIIAQLERAELLVEEGRRTGGRGQPPIDLVINPLGAFSFGVSFDHSRLVAILLNLGGQICGQIEFPVMAPSPAVVLPLVEAAVSQLLDQNTIPESRLCGVGVVMPALILEGHPTVLGPTSIPAWQEYPLAENLSARLGLPVLVDNDATAAAIGELLYGAGRRMRNFFYIYIGAGLGGGLILDGRPYRGSHGMSGELAHVVIQPGGRPCPCGNSGCLERYVSLSAAQAALTGKAEGGELVNPHVLAAAFAAKEPNLLRWLDAAAVHFRQAIVTIENLLDPEAVVVGGVIPDSILDALLARIEPLPPSVGNRHGRPGPRVLKGETGLDMRALGAASLAIFDSMTPDFSLLMKRGGDTPFAKGVPEDDKVPLVAQ